MKSLSKTVNGVLGRLGLHVSFDSSFRGLQLELARTQAALEDLKAVTTAAAERQNHARLLGVSKQRWQADEPDAGLTWGVPMEGSSFVRFLLSHVTLHANSTIVEIGPGYGRILDALLAEHVPFRRYIGLEISQARVSRLSERFKDPRIEFREADILSGFELNAVADLTISSAVFEHLYPDFSVAVNAISGFTRPGGAVVIDFVRDDSNLERSVAWFEHETTYIRIYSLSELKSLFGKSGLTARDFAKISFGHDIDKREIRRTIVFATKGSPAGPSLESLSREFGQSAVEAKPFLAFVEQEASSCNHGALEPPVKPEFRSCFGGLWPDLSTAPAILAGKVAIGDPLPAEAKLVEAWMRDGFVILPGAVSSAAIDAALSDFERAYDGLLARKMLFSEADGFQIKDAGRQHLRKTNARLLDLHLASTAVETVIFAEPLNRFLNILFERPALAFQSLGFYYGSQQSLHADYAFVRVSSPLEFVASWIALEDIQPGSGELEYYRGSHALPLYQFGKHLWAEPGDPEILRFSENLHNRARSAGLSMQRFLAKKGDVLIWAPGLMHGGSSVLDAELTRKSLVTHYCPADQQPMFAYKGGRLKRKSSAGNYVMGENWE